ncbi:MAG: endonuclease [Firmicutes bacterium]|nr:endonuclease [Bacillota bacterium]
MSVILTATLNHEDLYITKSFNVTIKMPEANDYYTLLDAKDGLTFNNLSITSDIVLPTSSGLVEITWHSSNEDIISTTGVVSRPLESEDNQTVTMTAYLTYNGVVFEKIFVFNVISFKVSVEYVGYYDGAAGLMGELLKTFLHDLIDDQITITYAQLWDALAESDEDPLNSNNVILFYTGRSQAKSNHGGAIDEWNREHIWPRSHGDLEPTIANTDMHHIRPTDVSVNAERGNLDFDEGGNTVYDGTIATLCLKDGDSFEPRDDVKGDVARMLFYMAVRYAGDDGVPDLEINNNTGNGTIPFIGKLSILLLWNMQDLPDAFEIRRNEVIFSYQGNRNPFIDHPEFANYIWGNN